MAALMVACAAQAGGAGTTQAVSTRPARVFYVSGDGSDDNSGTSPQAPWRTLKCVNAMAVQGFNPGDQIALRGGKIFIGNLKLGAGDSGADGNPVKIGSYGEGRAIIIPNTSIDSKKFESGSAIEISGTSHLLIQDLVLRGPGVAGGGGGRSTSSGIAIGGQGRDVRIENVETSGFGGSGINFCHDLMQTGNKSAGGYQDVSVVKCSAHDNGFGGIDIVNCTNVLVDSVNASYNVGYAYILDCGSGFGIRIWKCKHAVVQNCTSDYDHRGSGQGGSTGAIEADDSDYVLFQHNGASHDHQGIFDGDGIVFDGARQSVMQFNFTHDNDGCGIFLGGDNTCGSGDLCTARYNISKDDARDRQPYGGALIFGDLGQSFFYNNTIYTTASAQPALKIWVAGDDWGRGKLNDICIANNILVSGDNPLLMLQLDGGKPVPNVRLIDNDYWPGASHFTIEWGKNSYGNLGAFRRATGQEKLNGSDTELQVDPQFTQPGSNDFSIADQSTLAKAGMAMTAFGASWDPYGFAADPFLKQFFNTSAEDFNGVAIPGGRLSVGACQVKKG